MSGLLKSTFSLLALIIVVTILMGTGPASALDLETGAWSGPAFPGSTSATVPVTVTYACGDLLPAPVGGDIELGASLEDGAQGTISADEESFTVQAFPDCTPGDDVTESFNITYTATTEQLAGSQETITIVASHNVSDELEGDNDTASTAATVGPYVDVTFSAFNDTVEVIGGDQVTVEIEMRSSSNTAVESDAELELPEAEEGEEEWEAVSIDPITVASPLEEGEDGVGTITFDVLVPDEADGEHTLTFMASAASSDPPLETDAVEIPLTFDVTPRSVAQGDEEGSPAPMVPVVLLGVFGALALARRRTSR